MTALVSEPRDALPYRRWLFCVTVALGGALFWMAPRLPMGDLPQHAGQVALLHDLVAGTSRWADFVRINYLTPYLLAYSVSAALSFVMPVSAALKVVLTAGYFGFVAAGVLVRKEFEGDERLDWLLLPGFFGFSFQYGFLTFLVATPIGLLFLCLARRFALRPTRAAGARVVAAGLVLFYAHGLVFIFCVVAAAAMAAAHLKRETAVRTMVPYAILGLVVVGAYVNARLHEPMLASSHAQIDWEWNKSYGKNRILLFPAYVVASTAHDRTFLLLVPLMLAAPWLLGDRPVRDRAKWAPLAVVGVLWVLVPGVIAATAYIYHRFAVFLLPAYSWVFARAAAPKARAVAVEAMLAALCWVFFLGLAGRERRFAAEAAPFETVLAAAEPGQRALSIILDPRSPSVRHEYTYHTYPLWYQAERGGFVDFNFAAFPPQMVRFRPGKGPNMDGNVEDTFEWHKYNASMYRYFFVRHTAPLPAGMFDNDQCSVRLVVEDPPWALFERGECR